MPVITKRTDDERQVDDPDRGVSQALPTQNCDALSECDSSFGANEEGFDQPNVPAPAKSSTYKAEGRLPNGKWAPNFSGNPKGRKPKNPSDDLDQPSAFERALEKKTKVKDGEKKRTLTRRAVILEQWITQAAKGDPRARQQLIAYADKHGFDLFAGQHEAIRKAAAAAAAGLSVYNLSEEVVERLSPTTLNEIREVVEDLEAEKKNLKKMH
jgi:hypothetical protein